MGLTQKILAIVTLLIVCIFLGAGYYIASFSERTIRYNAHQNLNGSLELAEGIIDGYNQKVTSIANLNSQNRRVIKALDLGINRGVAQELNDSIKNSQFVNYIFIVDYDGHVFSTSTINYQKDKFYGEQWLYEKLLTRSMFSPLFIRNTVISTPGIDPFLVDKEAISQWVVSPILFREQVIGWTLISFDWQTSMKDLLDATLLRLEHAFYPVTQIKLSDELSNIAPITVGNATPPAMPISAEKDMFFDQVNYLLSVTFDEEEALSSLSAIKQMMLFIFSLSAVILTLALWISLRALIVQPLNQLDSRIRKISSNRPEQRLPNFASPEANTIASTINHLLQRIHTNTISIKRLDEEMKLKQVSEESQILLSQKLEAILDTAADGIVTIDQRGKILSFNQAAQRMFGYLEHDAIGMPVENLMPKKYASMHQTFIDQHNATGRSKIIGVKDKEGRLGREFQAVNKEGEQFPILLSIAKVETNDGVIFSGVIKDISKQKDGEQALIAAKEEAEEAAKSKSEFLAVMSHEIRTPMNGIIGMLDLLLENNLNTSQSHQAYLAHTSALSLLALLNDILDFSKIDADKLELERQHFNLRHMLGDFSEQMAASLTNPNVEIILDMVQVEHSMILADSTRIRQIFSNLVSNALKFTEQGEVVISARLEEHDGDNWQLIASVRDSGIGIPQDRLNSLFDKFSQVDASTTRRYGGTGLGLAIVKRLCHAMGGRVTVNSETGKGSEFSFHILVGKSDQSTKVIPSVDVSLLNILVVDDNAINREAITRQLQHWGAKVIAASSAKEALELCQRRNDEQFPMFDIALLDMQMPDVSGLELSQNLKANPKTQSIKLIMMTYIEAISQQNAFQTYGFSGYFVKPATTQDLLNALKVIASPDFSPGEQLVTHNYLSALEPAPQPEPELKSGLKLLVVEDNRVNQMVITGVLHKMGLNSTIANNGKEALDALSGSQSFDMILMDCQMPEMDGYEATHRIRNGEGGNEVRNIPIIAMTANAMESDRKACKDAGMNDFLTKPLNRTLLKEKLQVWSPSD
ncbi:response regulator [Vibrio ouci]|uniref:Sensory/regulatory protein RpfC n=1 Tax=Vibrio ouci TaxID=2499078 RepID=A0A4Y8WHP4_9VIBR|nr:response regulator [Vibrio ouci]TFH91791.1 response regulator [Vibrio ouci]